MLYFTTKFKNDCVVLPLSHKEILKSFKEPLAHTDISLRYVEKIKDISIPRNFWKYFSRCLKKSNRFIIFPFGYSCKDYTGHANYMIYDINTKTLERFEPNGFMHYDDCITSDTDNLIIRLFNKNMGHRLIERYYEPLDFCPFNNFQMIQHSEKLKLPGDPQGFCAVWSAFYTDLRLSNPNIDRRFLVTESIKEIQNNHPNFTKFIRDYAIFLDTIYDEIFLKVKNKNDLENILINLIKDLSIY